MATGKLAFRRSGLKDTYLLFRTRDIQQLIDSRVTDRELVFSSIPAPISANWIDRLTTQLLIINIYFNICI
jgi:hypothetical protein